MKYPGIKKAVGEYNKWIGHAEVMLNTETKEIWCNVYTSPSEFTVYAPYSPVERILSKASISMHEQWNTTSMGQLEALANATLFNISMKFK